MVTFGNSKIRSGVAHNRSYNMKYELTSSIVSALITRQHSRTSRASSGTANGTISTTQPRLFSLVVGFDDGLSLFLDKQSRTRQRRDEGWGLRAYHGNSETKRVVIGIVGWEMEGWVEKSTELEK